MFKLRIECEQLEWLDYVEAQNIEREGKKYAFTEMQKAGEVLSRYMMYMVKNRAADELVNKKWITNEQRNEVLLHVPNQKLMDVYAMIRTEVDVYIATNEQLTIEGFMSFRLKNAFECLRNAYKKAYETFCDIDLGDSIQLKQIMQDQHSMENDMHLIVTDQLHMTLRSAKTIYYEAHISPDDYESEDDMISQLVMTAPKKLHVFDPHDKLSKQIVVILRQLFEEKVIFYREEYVSNKNQ